ncbi:hypothetical protein EPUS_00895 [Endocarpon pusillum Z07020]|uniref:Uncharacterized protein n=1 Tax=Endocarpon pusillum (strain Z07020 / HMAS-L-300199) TaxID=1263415 RepID=U1G895_ENDPU|nr:uncharacterized protein EPUS_00895 [Endocarpon pusillum Z07020]ERF73642.1 hypothetical protein EPUS_00895 [Endocarpon pusillum Z07020]
MFIVQEHVVAWALAGLSLVLLVIATILNAIFAFSLHSSVATIQLLAFMALAINMLAICSFSFMISHYIPKLNGASTRWSDALVWRFFGLSLSIASVAALLTFITLVWAAVRLADLPDQIVGRPSRSDLIAWFAIWSICAVLQTGTYAFVGWWTKRALHSHSLAAVDLEFNVESPEMEHPPIQPRPTSGSFRSEDPTLASPPQTPTTIGMSSPFRLSHSGGKGGPTSSRTRLVHSTSFTKDSAKSSFDCPSAEAVSIDHPFDNWDTSGLARDVRTTLHSTPPVTRSGLATIPGSRPESPAKALDGPFLPETLSAAASAPSTAIESHGHSSSHEAGISSPPSSPPNFSRPSSRQVNQPTMSSALHQAVVEGSVEDMIHPLFRPSSPHPTPTASVGTRVTASPLAGQSITPKILIRMRSASMPQQSRPLIEEEMPPLNTESDSSRTDAGSPGPSIVEDDESGAVIPDFVLSAGQRSSYAGYDRRKSVKSRPASFHSQGDRLSMVLL